MLAGTNGFIQLTGDVVREAVEEYLNKRLIPGARVTVTDMTSVDGASDLYEFTLEDQK